MTKTLRNCPPRRYLPEVEPGPKGEFWRCGKDRELRISRCQGCGYWIHPHIDACRQCHSRNIAPETVSGKATLESWTVNHQRWFSDLKEPFVVGLVTLVEQEGLNLTTNIVNCDFDDLAIGMPVRVVFEHVEDVWLALFEPDREAALQT